jgi:hypothetical protein
MVRKYLIFYVDRNEIGYLFFSSHRAEETMEIAKIIMGINKLLFII